MEAVVDISKENLRIYAKSLRKNIKDKAIKDEIIKEKLLQLDVIKNASNILIYINKEEEVATIPLIKELLMEKKHIYAPRIENNIMNFYLLKSLNDLKKGVFNIKEPLSNQRYKYQEKDVIIVPGLLFDEENNRLGYGLGYYDKFLENLDIYKIGLCYQEFKLEKIETAEHDIKMNLIVTEVDDGI